MNPPKPQDEEAPWSVGFCDCFSDMKTCCIVCWCPCIIFGQIAEIVDKGSTSCGTSGALYTLIMFITGVPCLYSCFYRSKLREQYKLKGGGCGDCLLHCCCETCALTQEYRELRNRGFDMSIGCTACFCPCITFGQIAEITNKGSTSCGASAALYASIFFITGCPGLYSCFFRSRLRKQYNLEGGTCGDCMRHFWCEPCALTQEYRELENRGFDMYIGWHANVEKNPGLAMAPVVEKGMTK
ncbi:hypothetical protein V6N13_069771 [Hibiscus sabdariffa]|uniref:Uncharacterized protein n=1 Tax=Hibiscus sabdariffa TaxID=183260 RepID=A0ABR2PHY7_9ROSI